MNRITFAVLAVLVVAASASAGPIVTMTQNSLGGFNALDFYYSAGQGAEFTTYELQVHSDAANIQDPVKTAAGTFDADGDAVDTWANTVSSLLGGGGPSFVFTQYKPYGIGASAAPTKDLNWTVFDTETGDGNDIPGVGQAPWHLARVLVSPTAVGTAAMLAFDSQSGTVGTAFSFSYGNIPEPTTLGLLGLTLAGCFGVRRR